MRQKRPSKEKTAMWLDKDDLEFLRQYHLKVGVPVSESIRRAIAAYVETLKNRK